MPAGDSAGNDVGGIRDFSDSGADSGVFDVVLGGYEAVYEALPNASMFNRLWRENAYGGKFPIGFAHIGFLTAAEAQRMLALLDLGAGNVVVDVACGAGGPGLWVIQQSGATLIGVDPATAGVAAARERARRVGLEERARFVEGTFERTGLSPGTADAVMTIEAFQYAPDKRAALGEFFRILKPNGRLAIICFEVDPAKVDGVPVLGADPIADYTPSLEAAGFTIDVCEETPGWADRVYPTFEAVIAANEALRAEMGDRAAEGVLSEAQVTVALRPYRRRVLMVARRLS